MKSEKSKGKNQKSKNAHCLISSVPHLAIAICCLFLFVEISNAQKDKNEPSKKSSFFHNIFNNLKSNIVVSKTDSINKSTVINSKSVDPFVVHQGKVIRSINTIEMGFEQVFTDTSQIIYYYGTRILNALHTDTYDWVIRDNLFIKQGARLNPFLLSDNERYLRSLEFIQDARILVKPVKGTHDSVDLLIVTKDYFSITGSLDFSGLNRQRVRASESNLAGAGQKVQVTVLHDLARQPHYGFDFLYSKNSIHHTFINGSLGYSRINTDRSGNDNIQSFYLLLDRPLISPYSHAAGGFELSFNNSQNLTGKPDSQFYKYRNTNVDMWAGYNIGVNKTIEKDRLRNRAFVGLRYLNSNFSQLPFQIGDHFNNFFNNRKGLLAEVTFFRQEFIKTNYIYNFGTTEDVPYGHNIAATIGWYRQQDLARPYFGINANKYFASTKGRITQYFFRSGFLLKGQMQDVSLLIGGTMYSKIKFYRRLKYRHYYRCSFTRLFNRVTYEPLQINNALGLRYFNADTLTGIQRLSLYAETFLFAKNKLFGFQLSPFVFGDVSMLKGERKSIFSSDIFTGIGGGIRTRNANLIFPTIELRLIYFPRKAQDANSFKLSFVSSLSFRYNSNYVKAPDVIQVNGDDARSFY